jgi:hypothetical protein
MQRGWTLYGTMISFAARGETNDSDRILGFTAFGVGAAEIMITAKIRRRESGPG